MISQINFDKKKLIIIFSIIVFLFAFFIRIFYISQKVGIHIDEGFTHVISNFNGYQWDIPFAKDKIYTGRELRDLTFKNNTNLKEALQDVIRLRKNNNNDTCHCTLYNSIYLLWTQGGGGVLSPHEFIAKGCSLNLLFFILEFFIMFKILQRLFPDSYVIITGLAFAFLNTGSISNTLFIRPYQLQELSFVLLTYVFINIFEKLNKRENIINIKNGIFIVLSIAFTILTGYFAILYTAILGLILVFVCLKNKLYKNLLFLLGCLGSAAILIFAFYPGFLNGFTSMRAGETFYNASFKSGMCVFRIIHSLIFYFSNVISYLIYMPLILLMILAVYQKKDKYNKSALLLVSGSIIYSIIVMCIAPFKVLRYIVPIFPVMSIVLPMLIYGAKDFAKKLLSAGSILLLVIYAVSPYSTVEYTIVSPYKFFRAKIQNINDTEYEKFKFIQKTELPVIIINNSTYSCYLNLIFNMPDNQKYEFLDSINKIPQNYNHYFLLFERKYSNSKIENINLPKNYEVVDRFNPARFEGYELVRK